MARVFRLTPSARKSARRHLRGVACPEVLIADAIDAGRVEPGRNATDLIVDLGSALAYVERDAHDIHHVFSIRKGKEVH